MLFILLKIADIFLSELYIAKPSLESFMYLIL
jgi:hypothetical protein